MSLHHVLFCYARLGILAPLVVLKIYIWRFDFGAVNVHIYTGVHLLKNVLLTDFPWGGSLFKLLH